MRECSSCGNPFQPTLGQVKRRDWMCRPCGAERVRAYRARRTAEGRPLPISSGTRPTREYRQAWAKRFFAVPENRERQAAQRLAYRQNNPTSELKANARRLLRNALRHGDMARGVCEVCGATQVHGHHEDYSKPLEVQWLCPVHHTALHHKDLAAVRALAAQGAKA